MDEPSLLSNPWVLAVLAALAVVVLAAFALRRSGSRPAPRSRIPPPGGSPGGELQSLGLSEVRPRTSVPAAEAAAAPRRPVAPISAPREAPPVDPEGPTSTDAPRREAVRKPGPERGAGQRRPDAGRTAGGRSKSTRAADPPDTPAVTAEQPERAPSGRADSAPEAAGRDEPEVGRPRPAREGPRGTVLGIAGLLDSLRAALGARAVALLRHNDAADAYELVGRAGEGFGGYPSFPAHGNALHRVPSDGSISLLEPDALSALRYHARPAATVGQAAALALDADGRHVLVAERGTDERLFTQPQLDLLGDYADLVVRLLGAEPAPRAPASPATVPTDVVNEPTATPAPATPKAAAPEPADPGVETDPDLEALFAEDAAPAAPPQRRTILAEEMAAAREAGRPLAFALVVPRDAEAVAAWPGAALDAVEEDLRRRLEAVPGTTRVERFGELLLGVFGAFDAAGAEVWAQRVETSGSPVHIGIALLGDHHDDPGALRADAAAALEDAYERGETCVILE